MSRAKQYIVQTKKSAYTYTAYRSYCTMHIFICQRKKLKNRKVMKCRFFCLHIICDGCFFFFVASLAGYVLAVRYNVLFIYLLPYHSNADALGRWIFLFSPFTIENAHLLRSINLIFMFVFLFAFFPVQHFRWLS